MKKDKEMVKMNVQQIVDEIEFLRKHFKVLRGWTIYYVPRAKYKGQCSWNLDTKKAIIYRYQKGSSLMERDYLVHEMLHIALASVFGGKSIAEEKKEEHVVRAVCGLIFNNDRCENGNIKGKQ